MAIHTGPHSTVASYCKAMTKQRRLRRPPEQMSSSTDNDHYNNVKKGTKKATTSRLFCLLSGSKFLNFFVEAGGCKHILNIDVHAVSPVVVWIAGVVDPFGCGITFTERTVN